MVFHGPDPHLVGDSVAESPNSSASMMNDRVSDMLQKVHSYVKNRLKVDTIQAARTRNTPEYKPNPGMLNKIIKENFINETIVS